MKSRRLQPLGLLAAGAVVLGASHCKPRAVEAPLDEGAARMLFQLRCTPCHGSQGQGSPRMGSAVPDFTKEDFQASRRDEDLEAIIAQGGAALGKNPAMPANPDLARQKESLEAMRRVVRSFARPSSPR